jgi:hypothetical protein
MRSFKNIGEEARSIALARTRERFRKAMAMSNRYDAGTEL